jgi:hypothetical protein
VTEGVGSLRALGFVTRMQPKYAAFEATVVDGDIPLVGMAQLVIEVAPGNLVFRLADVAIKGSAVRPGSLVVEREFGYLELHGEDPEAVREAARLILDVLGVAIEERLRPTVVSSQLITNVTAFHAQLINRTRQGSLVVPGETVLVLEVTPAAYVLVAANEAERSAPIDIVDIRPIGRFGRLYVSGEESHVREAARGANEALAAIDGREAES